ncbi:MAG: DUF2085 domain-containing protein [Coriobacteriales bacterium]|jgi:uncharacterized membrane protein|nr:DUF2085 domain-containing protein [Coriobacteriales bacterium]
MHDLLQNLLYFFGHGFCHQLPERTLSAGGYYYPACARDTGIYLGIVFATCIVILIYQWQPALVLQRNSGLNTGAKAFFVTSATSSTPGFTANGLSGRFPNALPSKSVVILAVLCALPMAFDGVTSYLHLRETNNIIRFFTGYGAGMAVGIFASSAVMDILQKEHNQKRVLAGMREVIIFLAANVFFSTLFFFVHPYLGIAGALFAVLAFLLIVIFVNALLLWMSKKLAGRGLLVFALATVMAFTEIAVAGWLRDLLFSMLPYSDDAIRHLFG